MTLRRLWIALVILVASPPAQAFCPSNGLFCLYTAGVSETHEELTTNAIIYLDEHVFFPSINPIRKGMRKAMKEIADANAKVDDDHYHEPQYHFDGEDYSQENFGVTPKENVMKWADAIIFALETDNVSGARKALGTALHGIQDFYSHSNYIENGERGAFPALWDPSVSLTFVGYSAPTCQPCPTSGDCTNNITIGPPFLTSNYFGSEPRPIWEKCRHGGLGDGGYGPGGGINKDTMAQTFSPHYWLHLTSATAATEATQEFIKYIAGQIGNGQLDQTNSQLRQLLGVGPDLAIAIGVCHNNLPPYKSSITSVVNARLGTEQEPVQYVLVPFTDQGQGNDVVLPPLVTDNATEFKNAVNALTVDTTGAGTGDCPTYSMKAALQGLGKVDEGANLFLISDVDPKDYHLVGSVVSLAREKNVKIYPQIYGKCPQGPGGTPPHSAYALIASGDSGSDSGGGSGGQLFGATPGDIVTVTNYINTLTRTNGVDILSVSDTTSQSYTIPVDSSLTRLVFSLTHAPRVGANNYTPFTLTRPDGTPVQYTDPGVLYQYYYNGGVDGLMVTITTLPQGNWTASINNQPSGNRFQLDVSGDGSLGFKKFALLRETSGVAHPGVFEIDSVRAGQTVKGMGEVYGAFATANFELHSRTGSLLSTLSLSPVETGSSQFFGDVLIPNQPFLAYVKGSRSDGSPYQRVATKDYLPGTIVVTPPHETVAPPGATVDYNFTVFNGGAANTFYAWAADDKNPTWSYGVTSPSIPFTLDANAQTTVTARINIPSTTSIGTLNNLNLSVTAGGYNFTGVKDSSTVKTMVVDLPQTPPAPPGPGPGPGC